MTMYTKQFLERLYFNLPPLVPTEIKVALEKTMTELVSETVSVLHLEDVIITFSKQVWPYNQAFEELVKKYSLEMGGQLLLQKASYSLRLVILKYQKNGGGWDALYSGAVANLFTTEERVELHQILVDINCDVREFARQAALLADNVRYKNRLAYYQERLAKIQNELDRLRALADSEENEILAREIREQARAFELGIASIGPQVDYTAVCNAHEHFQGRRKELKARLLVRY